MPVPIVENTTSSSFIEEAEKRREKMLEEKSAAERQEKLLKQRENSVECKFWKQQKSISSEAKIDEKIAEFCTLPTKARNTADAVASTAEEVSSNLETGEASLE